MTGSIAARLVLRRSPPSRRFFRRELSQPAAATGATAAAERRKDSAVVAAPKELPPFDYAPPPYTGPSGDEILAKRREYLSPSIMHFYKTPVSTRCTGSFPSSTLQL